MKTQKEILEELKKEYPTTDFPDIEYAFDREYQEAIKECKKLRNSICGHTNRTKMKLLMKFFSITEEDLRR